MPQPLGGSVNQFFKPVPYRHKAARKLTAIFQGKSSFMLAKKIEPDYFVNIPMMGVGKIVFPL